MVDLTDRSLPSTSGWLSSAEAKGLAERVAPPAVGVIVVVTTVTPGICRGVVGVTSIWRFSAPCVEGGGVWCWGGGGMGWGEWTGEREVARGWGDWDRERAGDFVAGGEGEEGFFSGEVRRSPAREGGREGVIERGREGERGRQGEREGGRYS